MNTNEWLRVKDLFDAAVDLPVERRDELLDSVCSDDEKVREEARRLLAQYDAAGDFLNGSTDSVAAGVFAAGDVVANRYSIVRRLGAGGMGEVYEATDSEIGERIALKTILLRTPEPDSAYRRLVQEVQLARRVAH